MTNDLDDRLGGSKPVSMNTENCFHILDLFHRLNSTGFKQPTSNVVILINRMLYYLNLLITCNQG